MHHIQMLCPLRASGTGAERSLSLVCKPVSEGGSCLQGTARRPLHNARRCRGCLSLARGALTSRPAAAPAHAAPPAAAPAHAALPASWPRSPSAAAPAPPPSSCAAAPGAAALPPPVNGEQGQGLRPGWGLTGRQRSGKEGVLAPVTSEIVRGRAQGHPKQGATVITEA